jgi:hypothetical protein
MTWLRLICHTLAAIALVGAGCSDRARSRGGRDEDVVSKARNSPFSDHQIPPAGLSFTIPASLLDPAHSRPILEASSAGVIRVEWDAPDLFTRTNGYCLGLVHSSRDNQVIDLSSGGLIPARVSQLDDQGAFPGLFALEAPPDLPARPRAGKDRLILYTPDDATEEQIRSLPPMARFDQPSVVAYQDAVKRRRDAIIDQNRNQDEERKGSSNNLMRIGLAMQKFASVHGNFPPAAIDGPDGKPWHSWRVLLLPHLEQASLYNAYNFRQPWDGPDNKKLLEKMPSAYRKPGDKSPFTHYVVPRGSSTIFPLTAAKPPANTSDKSLYDQKSNRFTRISSVTDGTSNTIMVGTVDPGRKIEWTKPEDVSYADVGTRTAARRLASLRSADGFATPYMSDDGPYGLFGFADGTVRVLHRSLEDQFFTSMLTRNGGEVISSDSFREGKTSYSLAASLNPIRFTIRLVGRDAITMIEEIPRSGTPNPEDPSKPDQKGGSGPARSPR